MTKDNKKQTANNKSSEKIEKSNQFTTEKHPLPETSTMKDPFQKNKGKD